MQKTRHTTPRPATLIALALAAGLAALLHAPAQDLNGQPVNVALESSKTPVPSGAGTQTIITSGNTFTNGFGVFTFVTPAQIKFSAAPGVFSAGFSGFGFFGNVVSEEGASPNTISGVTLDPASTVAGFTTSNISFDAKDVFADFNGITFRQGQNVTLNLSFAPAAVPEPSPTLTFAVAGLGLGGLVVVARRRKGVRPA